MSKILQHGVAEIIRRLAQTLENGIADGSIARFDDINEKAKVFCHQWLGASLVARISHDDTSLNAAMRTKKKLIPSA